MANINEALHKANASRHLLDEWRPKAAATWDRIRGHALSKSMAHPNRLFTTALLAHRSAAVEGDFIETGVARGGASILMMAVLDDVGSSKRHFSCDSFLGLPAGTEKDITFNNDCSLATRSESGAMGCGIRRGGSLREQRRALEEIRGHFRHDRSSFEANVQASQVSTARMVVVPGWFNETLPPAGLRRIAFLRLDGDLYESTRDAITALYPFVASGGAIYVDDYGAYGGCRLAIDEFRRKHAVRAPMIKIWQSWSPLTRAQAQTKRAGTALGRVTPQTRAGYGFEAAWWIKE